MLQGSRFGRLLALVTLVAGLVGCAPLPIGSDSNFNAMVGATLSSPGAPLPATASAFESPGTPSQTVAPSQKVASAATDVPVIEPPPTTSRDFAGPTTRLAASRDSAAVVDASDYIISSQDILQVSVFQVPDLNRTVRVDGSGFVSLPLIGRVSVRDKTLLQAQEDIAARYSKSYLQSPQVSL